MRTDKIDDKNEEKKVLIVGVKKTEKISYTKPFDYYYKRALTRNEQLGEITSNLTSKEAYERQKSNVNDVLNSEKNRVREFKKKFSEKVGHAAYEKNLEDTAEMQERKYREENSIDDKIDKGR